MTAVVFHFEMSELKAEAPANTAQYKQRYKHQTVEVDGRVAMNGRNKKKEERCQQQQNQQANKQHQLTQTKETTLDCEKTYLKT
jgi:hypothetical protein